MTENCGNAKQIVFFDKSGEDVVFMADFDGGCFLSKFLQKINI